MSQNKPEIPRFLRYEPEGGTWLSSCDWGYCNREQQGWAEDEDGEWFAICRPCATGEDMRDPDQHRVVRFVSFEEARRS